MRSVLFVCSANVCRSPMAKSIFRQQLDRKAKRIKWKVESAGTWGLDGCEMAEGVKKVLQEMGIETPVHAARTVEREMLKSFNLILTMEKGHKEALRVEFPEVGERVYLLSEMVGESSDIRDPMGKGQEEFRAAAQKIASILERGYERIAFLAKPKKRG
jgi:protein-tyrosine-phosphatase